MTERDKARVLSEFFYVWLPCPVRRGRQGGRPGNAGTRRSRLDSFIDAIVGKRLTYARLIAKVSA